MIKRIFVSSFSFFLFHSVCIAQVSSQANYAFPIEETSIRAVHEAIKNKKINCVTLIKLFLQRIKQFNLATGEKPPFNALTEINASVLNEAARLDQAYLQNRKFIGPLHCIPIVIKDNIDSYDGTTTTGSYAVLGNQPIRDADLVARLRKAGAIILAHGTMDEFAWGMYGISSRSGRTGNAYDTIKSPGGSSGGPAVAVSANFAIGGIGTDNSGSVRIPAGFNGIFGLRPSTGLISQEGIFPMGNLDGIAGPMARTVEDLARILDVIVQRRSTSYTSYLNKNSLQGKRIAVIRRVGNIDTFKEMPDEIQKIMQQAMQKMRQLGAIVIEDIDLKDFDNDRKENMAGTIEDVNHYLASFPATRKNFQDICESQRTKTFGNVEECLKFMETLASKQSSAYKKVLNTFEKNRKYIENIMHEKQLDALFIPLSKTGSATYDELKINSWRAAVASNAGLPSIAMNVGYDQNQLPVAIELVGKHLNEGLLISLAYAYEQHQPKRLLPRLPMPDIRYENYSIPELNNLYTVIGKSTYDKIFENAENSAAIRKELTPEVFTNIVKNIS